ncbi:flagellar assembly protein T N-terminal domain-containing protein [Marinomonas aquiplantarum]|uniref:Flagellar assembly T-like protein n=1 Tax=Marinomonas aquiplantarum TaxID=491951 RepID=A0A366CUM2_9GAMM|nr:flagellar assembly protein T N-terminal domain-containing protein [Marinomonas aquiplantarum]RBO80010.1 flagellar assembly T-like protein [Marinomonas aquiplantarum]
MTLRLNKLLLSLVLVVFSNATLAVTIDAVGEAVIYNNDIADARYRATEQAIKQAVLESGSRVNVKDEMTNGEVNSSIAIRSSSHVQRAKIISEEQNGNFLKIIARIDVTPDSQCSTGPTSYYRKTVGVTGFDLQIPQQAQLGAINNISRELPKNLADEINKQGYLKALTATNISIYPDLINAPSSTNYDGSLTNVTRISEQLGVQYIISGVIRDIGELYQRQPNNKTNTTPLVAEDKERNFVVDIYLYDGFSGALLFEHRYNEIGNWDIADNQRVGFGSAKFWTINYGKVVQQALKQSALDTSEQLRCQPFIANIFRTEGNRIHIAAGSIAGIKVGDKFNVYRRYEVFNQLQSAQTQLNNANISVTIKQVQPNFSVGELVVDSHILNVQQQDVVIAW